MTREELQQAINANLDQISEEDAELFFSVMTAMAAVLSQILSARTKCEFCGKTTLRERATRRYCSDKCRTYALRQKARESV